MSTELRREKRSEEREEIWPWTHRYWRAVWLLPIIVLGLCCGAVYGGKRHMHRLADNSVHPQVSIPVERLGYFPPGELPSFDYFAAVSLHFIDAKHLLFAFGVKSLLRRGRPCAASDTQRTVRAVVLELPSGKVERQVDWDLYDFSDFLWKIDKGEFLFRRCNSLSLVGADLVPHPLIDAPGRIEAVMFSPDKSIAVVEVQRKRTQPPTSEAEIDGPKGPQRPMDAVFLRLQPLHVMAVAHLQAPGIVPVVHQGFLETLTAKHHRWTINLHRFDGRDRQIATVRSYCQPDLTPIDNDIVVAAMCPSKGSRIFQAYGLSGGTLWKIGLATDLYRPRFLLSAHGAHFGIESLHATRPIAALDPLGKQNIDAEVLDIYDTGTGVHVGSLSTTPVYTAGRNMDFSPDGQRVAILHNGAIEIYGVNELAKNRMNPQ